MGLLVLSYKTVSACHLGLDETQLFLIPVNHFSCPFAMHRIL